MIFAMNKLLEKLEIPYWELVKDDVQDATGDPELQRKARVGRWRQILTRVFYTTATHHAIDALLSLCFSQ